MRVLVTDADDRRGLAAVRSLAREGHHVTSGGVKHFDQAFFSKYTAQTVLYPNPAKDSEAFAEFLIDYVSKNDIDCVLPMSDYTTIPLSKHKADFLEHTHMAVPDYDVLCHVRDKPRIIRTAGSLGIGVPKTFCPATVEEAREVAAEINYPCVVKFKKGTGSLGIRYPRSPEELIDTFENPERSDDVVFDDLVPMVQEYVPGRIWDVCLLANSGRVVAGEVHRRMKMYPPTGGFGVTYETVPAPELRAEGIRLLEEVGWHGPALVEFKVNERAGDARLMEVNTRFWGGIDVSAKAGIDFVRLTARMAVEGDVEPQWDYLVGMKYRWLGMEWKRALAMPDRLEAFLDCLRYVKGARCNVELRDPLPHLVKTGIGWYRAIRASMKGTPR